MKPNLACSWMCCIVTLMSVSLSAQSNTPIPSQREETRTLSNIIVKTVCVSDFADKSSLTGGIQEAIDSLPKAGGTVSIPAGTYIVRRTIHIPANVTLTGAGMATVLVRPQQVMSNLVSKAGPGGREVEVVDASGFEIGNGISICDKKMFGWDGTDAEIEDIRGNRLILNRDLEKEYNPENKAVAINFYPIIAAENVSNVEVRNLCIDGHREESPGPWSDFVWAAIHFSRCRDSQIEACTVRNYISDGIGVQNGSGNIVRNCIVLNCHGHGFHPGTVLRDSVFDCNISRENDWDGLYFCADVRRIIVSNSIFSGNGWNGIGGLGQGGSGDRYNVVIGNTCFENKRCGIRAITGSDNTITGNVCLNNSTSKPGGYPGILLENVTDFIVTGNRCTDDRKSPTQLIGIEEKGNSDYNIISTNNCRGSKVKGIKTEGKDTADQANLK